MLDIIQQDDNPTKEELLMSIIRSGNKHLIERYEKILDALDNGIPEEDYKEQHS